MCVHMYGKAIIHLSQDNCHLRVTKSRSQFLTVCDFTLFDELLVYSLMFLLLFHSDSASGLRVLKDLCDLSYSGKTAFSDYTKSNSYCVCKFKI